MKTNFDFTILDQGLRLKVYEHEDSPGEFILSISRHGLPENKVNNETELRILGEAIRLVGLKAIEEGKSIRLVGLKAIEEGK